MQPTASFLKHRFPSCVFSHFFSSKDKWDSSGASEAISRVTANIPQGTQDYLSTTSQQLFDRRKLRSITVVFGIGEERPFYIEKAPSLLIARLKHNFQFFFLNYMVLTTLLFCLTMLTSPLTLIGLGLLGAIWMYVIRLTQSGSMTVYGKRTLYFRLNYYGWTESFTNLTNRSKLVTFPPWNQNARSYCFAEERYHWFECI